MGKDDYYKDNSEVVELCAADFTNNKVTHPSFENKFGLVKAYAPWCGFCKRFKDDMNFLAENLNNQGFTVGALNCIDNKELGKSLKVPHYPYLYQVSPNGELKPMELEGGRTVESVLKSICKFTNENNSGNGKCCKKDGNKIVCN
jgi:thiol-disulfide isomerase/thioredoxin